MNEWREEHGEGWACYLGDCLTVMAEMEANSVDTIVTDPPYGLEFMGKEWDKLWTERPEKIRRRNDSTTIHYPHDKPAPVYLAGESAQSWHTRWAQAALRVCKPGAMLLAFGGTRTWHRLACALEDAGWEIRDTLMWLHGSGFPKSLDISKAIDKAAGAEREVVAFDHAKCRRDNDSNHTYAAHCGQTGIITAPATPLAALWDGWGTALKPAFEPVILAMKPLEGTFAQNAEKWGVAGLNIDGGRIDGPKRSAGSHKLIGQLKSDKGWGMRTLADDEWLNANKGRWPANLLLDEEAAEMLDVQSGVRAGDKPGRAPRHNQQSLTSGEGIYGKFNDKDTTGFADTGGASRFFYCAKASRAERERGLEGMEDDNYPIKTGSGNLRDTRRANGHPTVKPLALMRYLVRLTATPTGGVVLDPFLGSGTTGIACLHEGRPFVGCEISEDYFDIAVKRLRAASAQLRLGL